jgi:2-methylisocitrate lyase-like PEP mutase family enzyme
VATQRQKGEAFRDLHAKGNFFLIPNPWDAGSARLLQHMGFPALATTGVGIAFSRGAPDFGLAREPMLDCVATIVGATDLPVSADLQDGFGAGPDAVAAAIRSAAAAGALGASIEDATGDPANPLFDVGLAADRIRAAVEAVRSLDFPVTVTARAETYLYGQPDIGVTIARLQAYQDAGADVLFAPGIASRADVAALVGAVDRPVNVLAGLRGQDFTAQALRELGVTRVSVGGALARHAYAALLRAGRQLLDAGTFGFAGDAMPGPEINRIFAEA